MPSYYEDNLDDVLGDYDDELPQEDHELALSNDAEGAYWLYHMDGYSVFNPEHMLREVRKHIRAALLAARPLTDAEIVGALKAAANGEVAYLQSFTGATAAPVRAGGPRRPKHPGNWADRTTESASSFTRTVDGQHPRTYPYDEPAYVQPSDDS